MTSHKGGVRKPSGSAEALGLFRLVFFAAVFLLFLVQNRAVWTEFTALVWQPSAAFSWIYFPRLPRTVVVALQSLWFLSLILSAIGCFTRPATILAFLLGVYFFQLPNNFGFSYHYDNLITMVLAIFAVSRCGDAWSVDARKRRPNAPPVHASEYVWPVLAIRALWCLMFAGAAVSKWRTSGLEWATSDSMRFLLLRHEYTHAPPTHWAMTLAQSPLVCNVLAGTALLFETLAPLALFSRVARLVLVPSLFLMQVGIGLVLGTLFESNLICYLCWLDWTWVASSLTARQRMPLAAHSLTANTNAGRA